MKTIFALSLVALVLGSTLAVDQLPDKFLGKWLIERAENFDEFLTAKGYGWLMRTLIKSSSMTKVFEKTGDTFSYKILTPTKDVVWEGIHFGKPYVGEYLDDSKHQVTFTYDEAAGRMDEKHKNLDNPDEKQDNYSYTVDGDYLVNILEYNGVVSKRYYKKIA